MHRFLRFHCARWLAALALDLASHAASALDPALAIAQLHHDSWTSKDGMPGDVWDMTQDRDGFLWLAATSGLYRFDGVRFEHVRAIGGTPLLSNVMSVVHAYPDGALWIGYRYAGIGVVRNGVLRHFTEADGYIPGLVHALERDGRGRVWAAAGRNILMFDGTRWHRIGADRGVPDAADSLNVDAAGRVWVSAADGLYRLDADTGRFVHAGFPSDYRKVIDAPGGAAWLDAPERLRRLPDGHDESPAAGAPAAALPYAWDRVFDRDGNLWETGCDGLCRIPPSDLAGRAEAAPKAGARDRLPIARLSGDPMIALVDREDDLWVATRSGVDRFRRNRIAPLALPANHSYIALALDGGDHVWINSVDAGQRRLWTVAGGAPQVQPERDVQALARAADGALLLARGGYIERRAQGARDRIAYPRDRQDATATLVFDDGAGIWANFVPGGAYRYAAGRWQPARAAGLRQDSVLAMARDAGGALWFGYRDDSVLVLQPGAAAGADVQASAGRVRHYGRADGLDVGVVGAVADVGGALLVAGDMGLAVRRGARFVPVGLADPQALAGITGMLADRAGDLWLNGGKGLVRIPAAAWRAFLRDPARPVSDYTLFDDVDGYPGIAQFGAGQASLLQDAAGRLWLAGSTGAASLDPHRLPRNPLAPPVHIEGITAGGRTWAPGGAVTLAAGTRSLQLAYTAPSLALPERVRFRYRLMGVDAGWQDAGGRRVAYYNNLRPGRYRFEVTAANEDGVGSEKPATLAVVIPPTFVESDGFKLLCGLAALAAAWLLLRLRVRRATGHLRRLLRERASERERIARTLHDTLMQSVQGLLMLFERARDQLPPSSDALPMLDRTLGHARATLREGRDELSALRGATVPERDLVGALAPLGRILGTQFGVHFDVAVHGPPRALRRDVALEANFIAREALQNAFRHARAATVVLEVGYAADAFVLRVRDDGRGLAPDAARPGHWGLAGMRERAVAIGAGLDIGPGPGGGTDVALRVPATLAYARARRRRWPWRRWDRGMQAGP